MMKHKLQRHLVCAITINGLRKLQYILMLSSLFIAHLIKLTLSANISSSDILVLVVDYCDG